MRNRSLREEEEEEEDLTELTRRGAFERTAQGLETWSAQNTSFLLVPPGTLGRYIPLREAC